MPKDESGQYALVDPEEYEHALDSPTVVPVPKKSLRWVIIRVVVLTEIVNLVLLAIGFLLFWYRPWIPSTTTPPPTTFNVTSTFAVDKHDLKLVANTSEADAFWMSITRDKNNGLVSLPKALAEERGLEASGLATKDGEIVFQVDAFHQLHCLVSPPFPLHSHPILQGGTRPTN